ncbi:MAG: hypothetical protein H7834_16750 [Magnetococcus sp. YQC-9]
MTIPNTSFRVQPEHRAVIQKTITLLRQNPELVDDLTELLDTLKTERGITRTQFGSIVSRLAALEFAVEQLQTSMAGSKRRKPDNAAE